MNIIGKETWCLCTSSAKPRSAMVTRWLWQQSLVLSLTWLSKSPVLTQHPQEKISAARPLSFFLPRHAPPSSALVPEASVRIEHNKHTRIWIADLWICEVLLKIRWKTAKCVVPAQTGGSLSVLYVTRLWMSHTSVTAALETLSACVEVRVSTHSPSFQMYLFYSKNSLFFRMI